MKISVLQAIGLLIVHSWTRAKCLPLFETLGVEVANEQKQPDPIRSTLVSSAACLFLGGRACSNNRIPADLSHQLDGKAELGTARGLVLPVLRPIFGADNFDSYSGADVNIAQPRVSSGAGADILGIFQTQRGVRDAGVRGEGNYGASWGSYSSVLGDLIGYGDVNDVNFNAERLRLDHEKRGGVRGVYEETFRTIVDPLSLKFGRVKETCYVRILFGGKGICTQQDAGIAPPGTR